MPTNEERHEVAARLRVLASHKAADEELTLDALGLYRGNNIEGFDTHCVMELADLIEPEHERTCLYVKNKDGEMVCSKCGCEEPIIIGDADYCYCCGAKVVEE